MARSSRSRSRVAFVPPMAATLVAKLPEGEEWLYEVKLDGYRALLLKDNDRIELRSRNDRDLTLMYPSIAAAARRLAVAEAIIDGEVVALNAAGRPSFQALQHRSSHPAHRIVFYAFDLLHLNGEDLKGEPLASRRDRLPEALGDSGLLISAELRGTAHEVVRAVRELGLEGVIAKRRNSRYDASQRGSPWVKLKLDRQQEFVIGGYRPGGNGIDALLVGYYEERQLHFAAKVRAGFVAHVRRELRKALEPLHIASCPFVDLPTSESSRWGGGVTADEMHEMQWVKPKLIAQVRFVEWTADNRLRHPSFLGLRTDKNARDVRRELAPGAPRSDRTVE